MTTPTIPQTSFIIRPLTRPDLDATAAIHLQAFPHAATSQLGLAVARRYHQALCDRADVSAFGVFVAGRLVGYCFVGTAHDVEGAFLRENLLLVSSRLVSRTTLLCERFLRNRVGARRRISRPSARSAAVPAAVPAAKFDERELSVRLAPAASDSPTIFYVAVEPHFQRRGAGRALLEHAEDLARMRGCRELHLNVAVDNTRAIEFFADAGWQRDPRFGEWQGNMIKPL